MILPIVKEPARILHRKALPVPKITPEIRRLAADMIETMHAAHGVGLAANQVGESWNLLVAAQEGEKGKGIVLLNASITRRKGRVLRPEGCLSLPGISSEAVPRSAEVTAVGMDLEGRNVSLAAAGFLAQILQHEVDHLEGRLYVDRLSFRDRQRLLRSYRSLQASLGRVDLNPT